MSRQETLSAPEDDVDAARGPSLSVVVTLFDEAGTLEELHRRLTAALESLDRSYEVLYVDDGSTDGSFAILERLHADDPHVRAVRLKRNAGQHPAMHAGLSRARGEIVVTMDGDLQNLPEDVPRLVEAVEAGYDVASGRRAARHDSWGRTLPSRLINGMLRRFTGVAISDFGCAFNAYRREAGRADARLDRPAEVHEGTRPLGRRVASSRSTSATPRVRAPLATRRCDSRDSRSTSSRGSGHSRSRPPAWCSAPSARSPPPRSGSTGVVYWISNDDFPGPLLLGALVVAVLGVQGFILALVGEYLGRIQRVVEHRPLYVVDREL